MEAAKRGAAIRLPYNQGTMMIARFLPFFATVVFAFNRLQMHSWKLTLDLICVALYLRWILHAGQSWIRPRDLAVLMLLHATFCFLGTIVARDIQTTLFGPTEIETTARVTNE